MILKGTPKDVVEAWYEDRFVHEDDIKKLLCFPEDLGSTLDHLVFLTTEDDDAPEHCLHWISSLIDATTVDVSWAAPAWALGYGVFFDADGKSIYYAAGNGEFDSSFPLLIFNRARLPELEAHYKNFLKTVK